MVIRYGGRRWVRSHAYKRCLIAVRFRDASNIRRIFMKGADLIVNFSLDIVCPYCKHDIDLSYHDDDHIYTGTIFNNRWDDLINEEIECPKCDKIFVILSVEQ